MHIGFVCAETIDSVRSMFYTLEEWTQISLRHYTAITLQDEVEPPHDGAFIQET